MITAVLDRCVCDSRYDGCSHTNPCGAPNDGTDRGPWCAECNPRRMATIRASLESLRAGFATPTTEETKP